MDLVTQSTDDTKLNILSVIYSYYIKYDVMTPVINKAFDGHPSQIVNVYIDLCDVFKIIYTRELYVNKKLAITAGVINMIAHYRNYFRTRHGVYTRIYLVYADTTIRSSKQFIETFGDDDYKKELYYGHYNSYVESQLELVKILTAYIDSAYYVRRKSDFSMFVYDEVSRQRSIPCVIITKTKYAYQIPALCPNSIILRPMKAKKTGEDKSFPIYRNDVLLKFFENIHSEKTTGKLNSFSPELLSLIMTLVGISSYNVPSICNSSQAIKIIDDAVKNQRIINGYNVDISYVYDNLNGIDHYVNKTDFRFRFSAIDMIFQHRIYANSIEAMDISWKIDLYDPKAVQEINNTYFADNPLDLESL